MELWSSTLPRIRQFSGKWKIKVDELWSSASFQSDVASRVSRVTQHLYKSMRSTRLWPSNKYHHPSISTNHNPQAGDGWHWPGTFSSLGINLSNFSAKDVRQVARLFFVGPGVSALVLLQSKNIQHFSNLVQKKDAKFVRCYNKAKSKSVILFVVSDC